MVDVRCRCRAGFGTGVCGWGGQGGACGVDEGESEEGGGHACGECGEVTSYLWG